MGKPERELRCQIAAYETGLVGHRAFVVYAVQQFSDPSVRLPPDLAWRLRRLAFRALDEAGDEISHIGRVLAVGVLTPDENSQVH